MVIVFTENIISILRLYIDGLAIIEHRKPELKKTESLDFTPEFVIW